MPLEKIKYWLTVAFLSVLLPVMCIDASPTLTLAHEKAKIFVDPLLDKSGLWQGSWSLFAKNPDKVNSRLSWTCDLENGEIFEGSSPDWQQLSIWQKLTHFRYMEFYDEIRTDKNKGAWESFATFLKRQCEASGVRARNLKITRQWAIIPAFNKGDTPTERPYRNYNGGHIFVNKSFSSHAD